MPAASMLMVHVIKLTTLVILQIVNHNTQQPLCVIFTYINYIICAKKIM